MSAPARTDGAPVRAGGRAAARARAGRRRARLLPALAAVRLLVARGVRRDALLLAAWGAVVALAVVVAVGGPRLAEQVLDEGARGAVRAVGHDADLVVTVRSAPVAWTAGYRDRALDEVELPALRGVLTEAVAASTSRALSVVRVDGVDPEEVAGLPDAPTVLLVLLDGAGADRVREVAGRVGADPEDEDAIPVAIPAAAAREWDLGVGSVLEFSGPLTGELLDDGRRRPPARVEVTAVVDAVDPADLVWRDAGPVWEAPDRASAPLVAPADVIDDISDVTGSGSVGAIRLVVDPERFDAATADAVAAELATLDVGLGAVLPPRVLPDATLSTGLRGALAAHLPLARAAQAQMAVPAAGVVGVVAVVLLLVARLLVARRRAVLELERARGASVGVVVGRLGVESVLVAALAAAAGLGLLAWLLPGPTAPVPLAAVLVTAVVATPLWGARVARRAWSGVREPANRRDRERLARRRAAARLVAEAAALALAAGAALALRGRGLLQTTTAGTDPFLAAAPLLVALAVTVVALRLYPGPVRLLAALARRSPGVLGVVGAARARRALEPLPLLALTLAASVGVSGLLLVGTIREGQEAASWQRVGADARIGLPLRSEPDLLPVVDRLRRAPGVDVATAAHLRPEQRADLGNRDVEVSVLAVDDAYGDLVARVPEAGEDLAAFGALADAEITDGRLPAVVDRRLAGRIGERGITVTIERVRWELEVVGTTDHAPRGQAPGPFLYLPLDLLHDLDGDPVPATHAWVQGPGAGDAVTAAAADLELPPGAVDVRTTWLAERRGSALVSGVEEMFRLGAAVAVVLAAVGMVATVLAGARERGRALALLRTLGMRSGLGWWLALAELAPVVVAAALAGAGAGVAVVVLAGSAMGLDVLTGGPFLPSIVVDPVVPAVLGGGALALLLVAASAEVAAHRRDRLSDVVRVGETPGS
jgi:putative ABC transport system permease protein